MSNPTLPPKMPHRPIQNGDCVFFKEIRQSSRAKQGMAAKFKHFGWGILLGAVPPFGKDPTLGDLIRALGTVGYIAFDDIGEFLGDEMGAKALAAFEAKYYAPAAPAVEAAPNAEAAAVPPTVEGDVVPPIPKQSVLVDMQGKPLDS